jgi:hypothetical protein
LIRSFWPIVSSVCAARPPKAAKDRLTLADLIILPTRYLGKELKLLTLIISFLWVRTRCEKSFLIKKGAGELRSSPLPCGLAGLLLPFVMVLHCGERPLEVVACIVDRRADTGMLAPFYVFADRVVLPMLARQLRSHPCPFDIDGAPPNINCNAPKVHLSPAFRM